MKKKKIVLPFEVYSALYGAGLLFDGFGWGSSGSGSLPFCALGCLAYVETGDAGDMYEEEGKRPSKLVSAAWRAGLDWYVNDAAVRKWCDKNNRSLTTRMPVDEYFKALNIVCEGEA